MVRVSKNLQLVVAAMLCTALAACSSSDGDDKGGDSGYIDGLPVVFNPMYSAFGGSHVYQVPVTIDPAALDQNAVDPIMVESIKWVVDTKVVQAEPFTELPGAVLLTTKAAGTTTVTAQAMTRSGGKYKGSATLQITDASDSDWDAGQARYDNGVMLNLANITMMGAGGGATGAAGSGGFMIPNPMAILDAIPKDVSCGNCHNNSMGLTVEHTPLQTAGYSDEELISIFTMGAKPMGAKFNSPFLKNLPVEIANTIYTALHKWDIPAEAQRGLVLKLRSITPMVQPEIDLTRLRMMFMNGMLPGAAPAGAAGSDGSGT